MKANIFLLGLVGMLCLASGQGRMADYELRRTQHAAHEAVMDSLREMPRWEQIRWLAARRLPDPYLQAVPSGDSGALRCIGRWSYGPATAITVKATPADTIAYLSRGSGVSVVRFRSQGGLSLDLLADINCATLTGRVTVQDSLLYVGSGGLETYDISDLTRPVRLSRSSFVAYDYAINDTFLYTVSRDSFRIYSIADPHGLRYLGGCRDSAYVMYVSGNHAYLGHQYGLYILDVSNPASPHRVSTIGHDVLSVAGRDTLLFIGTYDQGLRVYNVRNPAGPVPVGTLADIQTGDIHLPPTCDTVLYTPTFDVISIRDPRNPTSIGHVDTPGWGYGITAVPALNYALVADYFKGLTAVNIVLPKVPFIDTSRFGADLAEDIHVDGTVAYVANERAGLQLLDVSDPVGPSLLAHVDTSSGAMRCRAALGRDSFAYIGWYYPWLRTLDVSDPASPRMVGGCNIQESPRALALRDSLLYVAMHYRFQVVNVARPREPRVVGEVRLSGYNWGVTLQDTLAYVGSWDGLIILNVARPDSPYVVSTTGGTRTSTWGVAVRDTLVFVPSGYETLWVFNAADPRAPYPIAGAPLGQGNRGYDAVMFGDSFVFVGCRQGVVLVDISDAHNPVAVAAYPTPAWVRRVSYAPPYLYAACSDGGVVVFETTSVGIKEPQNPCGQERSKLEVLPTLAKDWVGMRLPFGLQRPVELLLIDVSGRPVRRMTIGPGRSEYRLDVRSLSPGLYFVVARTGQRFEKARFVKP